MRRVWSGLPGTLLLGVGVVVLAAVLTRSGPPAAGPGAAPTAVRATTGAHTAPPPRIVRRAEWMAGVKPYDRDPVRYADRVVAVFLHHTDSPNGYDCADTPRIIRFIYAGQAGSKEWDDIGYNFLVDRCGTVYEGRAGGVDRPVVGAHTQGFNQRTAGIAAIGTFTEDVPVPRAMADSIAALAAWKLGLSGADPRATVRLTSSNSLSRFKKGTSADFHAISGHRDGYETYCPGESLMAALPAIREKAAHLQGRDHP
ncbi:peptidoglycan recognition protein [Streptomyces sp. NPDC049813]|uniref:peptidoglycan recognition protein n=1 Tax=Streptomyces sp. NPDC049813 TaxID=3365597 RepID=UPI0037A44465